MAISTAYLIGSTWSSYHRTGRVRWRNVAYNAALIYGGGKVGRRFSGGWRRRNVVQEGKHWYRHRGAGGHHRRRIDRYRTGRNWATNAAIAGGGYYASRGWAF